MARMKVFTLMLLSLLALASCSAFFGFNAFSSLQTPPTIDPAKYTGLGGLAALASDLSSAALAPQLIADASQIETELKSSYGLTGAITTVDQQQAAVLCTDLELKATSGDQVVNNVFTTLASGTVPTTIEGFLGSVMPADVLSSQTAFTAMVSGLLDANTIYTNLSAGFTPTNGVVVPGDNQGMPSGTNMGDVAQKMAVAYSVNVIAQQLESKGVAAADVPTQLYLLATNPTSPSVAPGVTGLSPDISSNATAINTILGYAGLAPVL